MLKIRVLTALLLAPLFFVAVVFGATTFIASLFAAVVLLGAWEWARLCGYESSLARACYVMIVAGLLGFGWLYMHSPLSLQSVLVTASCWWLLAAWWVSNPEVGAQVTEGHRLIKAATGALVLIPVWMVGVELHRLSPYWVVYSITLVALADTGAYFSGRKWGRHKLAPRVSPGKSWEGVGGALAMSVVVAVIAYLGLPTEWLPIKPGLLLEFIFLSVVVVAVSIVGDLYESMLKRHAGLKDSGTLLPGHGGVLDRIDSLTAAFPVFLLGFSLLEMQV